jgi:Spy/CpxP family protein refolding chaperone
MLFRLALGTVRARKLIQSAVVQDGHFISKSCLSPIAVGWLRPVVILPQAWKQWPLAQLDAVLTHEAQHVARYDPLVQWLALLNRAVFWFHPVAWWLEQRLAALAEEACDSAVLSAGHTPQDYSEYLLDLARSSMHASERVVGTAMPGRNLTHRIHQIFEGVPMQPVSRIRVVCIVVLCTISSVVFAAATPVTYQVNPGEPKVAAAPAAAFEEAATQPAAPATPAAPLVAAVPPQQVNPRIQEDRLNAPLLAVRVPVQKEGFRWRTATARTTTWLQNPFMLSSLGLTDEQRSRIDATLEAYSLNIAARTEQMEKEESLYNALLEADQVDRNAALAQLDRVIQARAELERANAAMTLEMREYVTQAQWIQLQTVFRLPYQSDRLYGRPVIRTFQWSTGKNSGNAWIGQRGRQ